MIRTREVSAELRRSGHTSSSHRHRALILSFDQSVDRANGALENAMISLEDCIAFSGLDKNEVEAISEHEHIPEIAAAALANYLLK